ncbi:MAG: ModE family transcriptional regulator [Curvibacter sp. RIFCSPHIGHO2_12_FULL_63_18]|uniref:TOBE domain-containing protein n=1 Tax=Rhodoferax sp. TaxID=50421 RepID=UPI0008B65F71|nr:TOBE domain-containing protein [Rhodoferax sp.]OGO94935.1 MAG: ModE family transcriptional regulator [Curvibacter sp. GWA2_63_95]OGP01378.1 MAG: ModE family transcriptional regulator [Curvibacter sp. RIFCSPHIGHO2_12_FULL_63_18]HCX82258.1 ModE family transcriptional regulator [Rhodoferax sp.]
MTSPPSLTGAGLAGALGHEAADKRLDILRRIGQVGSISEAARGADVSYKAAWQAIDTLTNLAGAPLVERTVGGSGGGGAQLTATGLQLLEAADTLAALRRQALAQVALRHAPADGVAPRLAGLGLRTSMRNQLPCQVLALQRAGRAMQVRLGLSDGSTVVSRVTRESTELLGLAVGGEVLALAKATAVTVVTAPATGVATVNRLHGTVARLARSTAGDEIVLTLACGLQMVGFAAPGLQLKVGQAAVAVFDDAAVVLAVGG